MQVEQIDRDAAADNAVLAELRELIREGRADHHAEAFARHRLAECERIVGEIVHLEERMADDVTPSFPPAGIRAGRLFCASARLKQWAA